MASSINLYVHLESICGWWKSRACECHATRRVTDWATTRENSCIDSVSRPRICTRTRICTHCICTHFRSPSSLSLAYSLSLACTPGYERFIAGRADLVDEVVWGDLRWPMRVLWSWATSSVCTYACAMTLACCAHITNQLSCGFLEVDKALKGRDMDETTYVHLRNFWSCADSRIFA